jgi:peptidyl-prolyl cis-trans isomerase D
MSIIINPACSAVIFLELPGPIKYNLYISEKETAMLKVFRNKNVAKMVLWGILILILPAFVLWGTGNIGRSGPKGPTYAGMIDGKKVSFDRFGHSLVAAKCQVILNFFNQPKLLDKVLSDKELMGRMAWDRLIIEREAKKAGIKVPNDEVVKLVTSHPIFQRNGSFDAKIYDYVLRRVPIDPRSFEEIVRENLAVQKMNDSVSKDVTVTDEEVFEAYRKDNEKIRLSYAVFPSENFLEKTAVSDDQMKEYYEAHKSEFTIPAKTLEDGTVSEGGVAKLEDVKDNIKVYLATVEARKLALKAAGEEYAKIKEFMAKDKAATFEAALEAGKLKKAETAFFARNEYIDGLGEAAPLTDAAVKLKPGEVSAPVEARRGAVIFKVAEVQKSDEEKFKKEKDDYAKKALELKKLAAIEKWVRQLELANRPIIDFRDYEKYYR